MSNAKQKRRYYRENPEKYRARARRYYRRNRRDELAKKSAWNAANPDIATERCRAFRAAHPNYFRDYRQRRRLRDAWLRWTTVCAKTRAMEAS